MGDGCCCCDLWDALCKTECKCDCCETWCKDWKGDNGVMGLYNCKTRLGICKMCCSSTTFNTTAAAATTGIVIGGVAYFTYNENKIIVH